MTVGCQLQLTAIISKTMNVLLFFEKICKVSSQSVYHFVAAFTVFKILVFIASIPVLLLLDRMAPMPNISEGYSKSHFFVLAIIIAPIVETLLFQCLPMELLSRWFKSWTVLIGFSSILFALTHLPSYAYAFSNLLSGIMLGLSYLLAKKFGFSPFISTASIHGIRNLIVFTLTYLFDI